ncbi:MAG: GNAT family N-acetyltransferase [Ignavibacteriales bacterium]|jgi:hypothetical protein|nr:MAG: GNAT family N-acetyltransferase [Ignavibacteriales bacterium]
MKFNELKLDQIDEVFAISESYDLTKGNQTDRGFLVSSFTRDEYESFYFQDDKYIYVATDDNRVIGFIYGYYIKHADPSVSSDTMKKLGQEDDFIVKQICAHQDAPIGTGTFLMHQLFQILSCSIYLAIVAKPLNVTSLIFHKKMGFCEIARITEKDQLERIIMVRYKHQDSKTFVEAGLLQYQIAVDLYKHEDQLTWTKFNFSVITNGAILAMVVPAMTSDFNKTLFLFLAIVVIIINFGYIYTIRMGRIYLQKRKKDACGLEEKFQSIGMNYIIKGSTKNKKMNHILENSFTRYVQFLIPIMFIIGWIVILFLVL